MCSRIQLMFRHKSVYSTILLLFIIVIVLILNRTETGRNLRSEISSINDAFLLSNSDTGNIFKKDVISIYRKCLIDEMSKTSRNAWDHLHVAVSFCLGQTIWLLLDVRILRNRSDHKLVILSTDQECTHVTLGVGGDITSEEQLRALAPNCRFFGADPSRFVGQIYEKIGHYSEVAVGAEAGILKAFFLKSFDKNNYHWVEKEVKTITLVDYLKLWINISRIDYLFMDIEGAEFRMFEQLLTNGVVERNNITICQISVEMHNLKKHRVDIIDFHRLIMKVLWHSSFVPIWSMEATKSTYYHVRSFYLNLGDPYCLKKYFQKKLLIG